MGLERGLRDLLSPSPVSGDNGLRLRITIVITPIINNGGTSSDNELLQCHRALLISLVFFFFLPSEEKSPSSYLISYYFQKSLGPGIFSKVIHTLNRHPRQDGLENWSS
jgi:hypothetical protein